MAYCKKGKTQGVGFIILWKPRLRNYKSHIKKTVRSCQISVYFVDKYFDEEMPFKYLSFFIIDIVNNKSHLPNRRPITGKIKFWGRHSRNTTPETKYCPWLESFQTNRKRKTK